jgi:hypothetical protein
VLTPNDFTDLTEVQQRLLGFQRRYQQTAMPFDWRYTRADLDRLLHRLDELAQAAENQQHNHKDRRRAVRCMTADTRLRRTRPMTQQLATYLEVGVGAHVDNAVVAWAFDLDLWGTCGQGLQEADAVAALEHAAARARGGAQQVVAVERIHGDEQAFARDHQPATPAEQTQTLAILRAARQQTLALVSACPDRHPRSTLVVAVAPIPPTTQRQRLAAVHAGHRPTTAGRPPQCGQVRRLTEAAGTCRLAGWA